MPYFWVSRLGEECLELGGKEINKGRRTNLEDLEAKKSLIAGIIQEQSRALP